MISILGISDLLIYEFFARSLYQQLDKRLLNLANAAAHSLIALKQNIKAVNHTQYRFDQDGDLDIPWQNLHQSTQSIEWFDENKQRLTQAGLTIPNFPVQEGFHFVSSKPKLRTLTIVAYSYPQGKKVLEGFIRVSEFNQEVEDNLQKLRRGFYLGGLTAIGLIGLGGSWLTRQSLKPIEQSYQQLKQFTADASHELRSPLTVIKTSLEVIQTHPERIHPSDVNKLKGILSATNQMSSLVEDLLLLARTDSQISVKELMVIPLEELLEDVIEFFDLKAETKDISLKFNNYTPVSVLGEPSQLRRLFSNLLDNAIKYTNHGGTVTVSLEKIDKFAVVSIQDTGIGIATNDLPFVFNRFWREDSARCHQEGTGLGLAIAKAITQYHEGTISVTSTLGVGTNFNVRLPMDK
jgi:signal transduction histidine kinase